MGNINYSLLKDYLVFNGLPSSVTYYVNHWEGLGISSESTSTGSPYGTLYNPGNVINFNTLAVNFVIDENWIVFEEIFNLLYKNAPLEADDYERTIFDIDLHLMSNTYKKEIGYIRMYSGYVQDIMNVTHDYNASDNTIVNILQCTIKYQYHKFFRAEVNE